MNKAKKSRRCSFNFENSFVFWLRNVKIDNHFFHRLWFIAWNVHFCIKISFFVKRLKDFRWINRIKNWFCRRFFRLQLFVFSFFFSTQEFFLFSFWFFSFYNEFFSFHHFDYCFSLIYGVDRLLIFKIQ